MDHQGRVGHHTSYQASLHRSNVVLETRVLDILHGLEIFFSGTYQVQVILSKSRRNPFYIHTCYYKLFTC